MAEAAKSFIYALTHFYIYYGKRIDQHRLFFRNPENHQLGKIRVRRPFLYIWLPMCFTLLFGIRALLAIINHNKIQTNWDKLIYLVGMWTKATRVYSDITVVIWTVMVVLISLYVIREDLNDYMCLAVLTANRRGPIKPIDLQLNKENWKIFAKQRKVRLFIANFMVMGVNIPTSVFVALATYPEEVNFSTILIWIAWNSILTVWLHTASSSKHIFRQHSLI